MLTEREQIVEVISRLFYYTDEHNWAGLQTEVFAHKVEMDMTSMGAPAIAFKTADEICEEWQAGFKDLDAVHHQSGNILIDIEGDQAEARVHAIASHYKKDASKGNVREFVGSYDFHFTKTANQWKLDLFKFNLKYMVGNLELK